MAPAPGLLHSVLPGDGIWATLLEVGGFLALLAIVFGVVVVHDDGLEGRTRALWLAIVVALPIVGTIVYLVRRRRHDC